MQNLLIRYIVTFFTVCNYLLMCNVHLFVHFSQTTKKHRGNSSLCVKSSLLTLILIPYLMALCTKCAFTLLSVDELFLYLIDVTNKKSCFSEAHFYSET